MRVVDKFKQFGLRYLFVIRRVVIVLLIPFILIEAVWDTVKDVPINLKYRLNGDYIKWKRYWNERD